MMPFPQIEAYLDSLSYDQITAERKQHLDHISHTMAKILHERRYLEIVFLCTHNSRRSIFSEIMSHVLSDALKLPFYSYSGGAEGTYIAPQVITTLEDIGFETSRFNSRLDTAYHIKYRKRKNALVFYSHNMDNFIRKQYPYITISTCDEATETCPVGPAEAIRFSTPYEDPKVADGTPMESAVYRATCDEITTNLLYIYNTIKQLR